MIIFIFFQLVICIRHVHPQSFEVFEDYIGLYATDKTTANQVTFLIKDVLCRSGLPLHNCKVSAMKVLPTCQKDTQVWPDKFSS